MKNIRNIDFYDVEEKIELELPSRNTKINITSELLSNLEKQFIDYKFN